MARGRKTGGRKAGVPNKATSDVRAVAQQHTQAAIARLAYLMQNAASEQAQIAAAKELLDRAHGRPSQSVEANINDGQDFYAALAALLEGTGRGLPSEELRADEGLK